MAASGARVILVVAVTAITLGLLELGARAVGFGSAERGSPWYAGGNNPRFLFQPDDRAGYVLRPGFAGVQIGPSQEFRVGVSVDVRGFREPGDRSASPGGILAIGDSMTFGEGVEQAECWPARLEKISGIPVVNGGVPGYSSLQMAARTEQSLRVVRPKLVLFALFARWDLWRCDDPLVYREGFIAIQSFADKLHLVDGNLYPEVAHLGSLSARALAHSAILRSVLAAFSDRGLKARATRRPDWSTYRPCLEAVARAMRAATSEGAAFRVVLLESSSGAATSETTDLIRRLEEAGIPYLSLDQLMSGRDRSSLRYERDGHWNAGGHAAAAEVLAPVVGPLVATTGSVSKARFDRPRTAE
jgi:hypothetical protein